jgi:cellulose synthase/poly-beta-1,6-N-acetylglucosamine synthase-like glycosyltransferase
MIPLILLVLVSALLVWSFGGYALVMGIVGRRAGHQPAPSSTLPFFSVLIPTYNEASAIGKRIGNLLTLEYPQDRFEILIVDSGSTDGTAEAVQDIIRTRGQEVPSITLVQEKERSGKGSAINAGRSVARGEVILVSDANAAFHPGVLGILGPAFADPRVGGVGGRYCVANPEQESTEGASFYWDLECLMRKGEAALDSACLFHGEINAWRKDLVDADPSMLSEDLDMAIRIRRAGRKIGYEPRAVVHEPAATTRRDQITQRRRTATGTMQAIGKHLPYLLTHPGWYTWVIVPSHKILPLLTPWLLLAIPVLYFASGDLPVIVGHAVISTVILGLVLAGLRHMLRREPCGGIRKTPGRPGHITEYVVLNELLIVMAWWDFLTGRYTVLWEKVKSTRNQI